MRAAVCLLFALVIAAAQPAADSGGERRAWYPMRDGWSGPQQEFITGTTLVSDPLYVSEGRFTVFQTGGGEGEPMDFWRFTANGMAEYKWRFQLISGGGGDRSDLGRGLPFGVMIVNPDFKVCAVQDVAIPGDGSQDQVLQATVEIPYTGEQMGFVPIVGATRTDLLRLLRGTPSAPAGEKVPEYLWHYAMGSDFDIVRKEFVRIGNNHYRYYFEMTERGERGIEPYEPWEVETSEDTGDDELWRDYGVILYDARGWAVGYVQGQRRREGEKAAMFASGEVTTVAPAEYIRIDQPIYLASF